MEDRVYRAFLDAQYRDAEELNGASELVKIVPQTSTACRLYAVSFLCRGLVKARGVVQEHDDFTIAVSFAADHLRRLESVKSVRWLSPENVWHPQIRPPLICLGKLPPGSGLITIIEQAWKIITYQRVTVIEWDSLNSDCSKWARANTGMFPVDDRPLRQGKIKLTLDE